MKKLSKITLGTAQLGMNYGISNFLGKPSFVNAINLLKFAWENGINSFDTAPAYGNSEDIIGSFIESEIGNEVNDLIIISKLPKIEIKDDLTFKFVYDYIHRQIENSLKHLKIQKIPVYLLHHTPDLFLKNDIVINCLSQLKKEGLLDRFGVSIYTPEEAKLCLNYKEINAIQLPINIFDLRLFNNDLFEKLRSKDYLILGRSVYLQGLFFLSPENLPEYLSFAKEYLIKLKKISEDNNIDIAKLSFLFVRDIPQIDSLIIGAENIEQIAYNLKLINEKPLSKDMKQIIFEEFSEIPEKLINPSLWNKRK